MTACAAPVRSRGARGRERAREGAARLLRRIAPAALALALAATAAGDAPRPPAAELLPPSPGADVLLALPREEISQQALERALARLGHETLPAPALAGAARIRVPEGVDPGELARELAASGLARAVEEDGVVRTSRLPGDPLYPELQSSYMEVVRAPEAWDRTPGAREVVIAVVDTGIDFSHPDLRERLWTNEQDSFGNRQDDDQNGCVDDTYGCSFVSLATADPSCGYQLASPNWLVDDDEGHGSFVASIAAASGDDGTGITGVSWETRLLAVKVLDCTGTGRISDAATGIRYAARAGADIINVSFGSPRDSRLLREAIAAATDAGALVVASAGNEGPGDATFPARYESVLSVSASGQRADDGSIDYRLASSFGSAGAGVDLLAPGLDLAGAVPERLCGQGIWRCRDGEPYAVSSGSSYAAPVAAGAAALLLAERPWLTPALARGLMVTSASRRFGRAPLLDVAALLEAPLYRAFGPGTARPGGPAVRPPEP